MTMPRPSLSNFAPISRDLILLSFLYGAARPQVTLAEMRTRLAWLIAEPEFNSCLQTLAARGDVDATNGITLTRTGSFTARSALGREGQGRWKHIRSRLLPLIPLGLTPSEPLTQRRFARAENLRAAIIRVGFALSCPPAADLKIVCSELLWSVLQSALPQIERPSEPTDAFGPTERAVLASVAKFSGGSFHATVDAISAVALGLDSPVSVSRLRDRLIQIGVGGPMLPSLAHTS